MIFTEEDQLPFYTCDLKLFPGDNHKQPEEQVGFLLKGFPCLGSHQTVD